MEVTSSSTAANVAVTDKDGNGGQHKAMLWSIQEAAERYTEQIGVSACGATAVVDVLQALGITVAPKTADRCVQTKLRRNNSPLPDYLHSRSEAGATHVQLIDGAKEASAGRVLGRFFGFYPPRQVNLVQWLAHWIRQRAVPVATMNMQRGVAEVSEEELHVRLCSESVLLIRREDVFKRLESDSLLPLISDRQNDPRWKILNVEAQVRKMIDEENCEEDHPKMTHITIPAAYSSGITIFALRDSCTGQELLSAPELPLL